jgi:hypothetical protein
MGIGVDQLADRQPVGLLDRRDLAVDHRWPCARRER